MLLFQVTAAAANDKAMKTTCLVWALRMYWARHDLFHASLGVAGSLAARAACV